MGAVAAWLLSKGIVLDSTATNGLVVFLTGAVTSLYYLAVRLLEQRFPQFGWLLGNAKKPVYVEPEKVDSVEKKVDKINATA